MKRIFLFLVTNMAVLVVISVILSLLGLNGNTQNLGSLLAYLDGLANEAESVANLAPDEDGEGEP